MQSYHAIRYNVDNPHPLVDASGVDRVPIVYGGFDMGRQDVISDADRSRFRRAIRAIPADYDGLALIDLEGPAWRTLRDPYAEFADWQDSIRLYAWLLHEAYRVRPRADWGHWGLPNWYHGQPWWSANLDPAMLTLLQGAVFPNCYDTQPGSDDDWQPLVVGRALSDAKGLMPVYPFISCRSYPPGYQEGTHVPRLSQAEFQTNLDRIASAAVSGRSVAGLVLWDATSHDADLGTVDAWHATCLEMMADL
jgi:hypothetical protein